jgi:DNA polymerase-3 subunit gamma/tau
VTNLKNAVTSGRLANAYLFSGPHGVGKTSMARIFAKSLNCKEGPTIRPCQKCPACLEISHSRSLDVIEIDGASNRGIEEIRTLRENVKFAPTSGTFKIYIIDEVHMLTTEAFNALLKTLEEPPKFVKFIFATTQPQRLLPTIISRCQRFNFRRISLIQIIGQLKKILTQEKIAIEDKVIAAIARASEGSLRDAESILDQLIVFNQDKLSLEDVSALLGVIKEEALFALTEKIIEKDAKAAIELLNKLLDEGKDSTMLLANLLQHFRNLMIAKISQGDAELIDLPEEVCAKLYQQSQSFSLEEIIRSFNILVNTQEMTKRLDSGLIALEIGIIKLTQEKTSTSSSARSEIPKTPKVAVKPQEKTVLPDEANRNPVANDPQHLAVVKNSWHKIIENLKTTKMSLASYLHAGSPLGLKDDILTVSLPKNYSLHKEVLEKNENRSVIEKAIEGVLNLKLRLDFILSKEEAELDNVDVSPLIQSALDTFNAKKIK